MSRSGEEILVIKARETARNRELSFSLNVCVWMFCPHHTCVNHVCAVPAERPEEKEVSFHGTGVSDVCEPLFGVLGINPESSSRATNTLYH